VQEQIKAAVQTRKEAKNNADKLKHSAGVSDFTDQNNTHAYGETEQFYTSKGPVGTR
jgi:hypothetical protein